MARSMRTHISTASTPRQCQANVLVWAREASSAMITTLSTCATSTVSIFRKRAVGQARWRAREIHPTTVLIEHFDVISNLLEADRTRLEYVTDFDST